MKKIGVIFLLISLTVISAPAQAVTSKQMQPLGLVGPCPLLPANNIWNVPVDNLPVDPNSDTYIRAMGAATGLHPDFGSGTWDGGPIGIPYNFVPGSQPGVSVQFDYAGESDPGLYPIPANPKIEWGSDHHILMVDQDRCKLYEMWDSRQVGENWYAGSGAIFDLNSNALRHDGWTSADAAGLPILPGLVRYEEVASGAIRHALRFTVHTTQYQHYVWPARHWACNSCDPNMPPMGQRFRLKASFNISSYSPQTQIILQALKTYGMIVADNGTDWYISGAPDPGWDDYLVDELKTVLGSNFEAVDESSLMGDPNSGEVLVKPSATTGSATDRTQHSAKLNGTVYPNGVSTTYYFQWGPTTAYGNITSTGSGGSGWSDVTVSADLTGLSPKVAYHYRLVATYNAGTTYGSDGVFTTQPVRFDFNDDGKADILWRNSATGQIYNWLMNGVPTPFQGSTGTVSDLNWKIKGVGDFNGDWRTDILWRNNASGQVYIWLMDGTNITSQGSPATVGDLAWEIKGVGDFNGDGNADILWRHKSSGMLYIWLMDGTTITSQGSPGTVSDLNWEIKGVGDFNGDGKFDILWRHAVSGQIYIWLMDGRVVTSMGSPGTVGDLAWEIKGVGDFNGDGKFDILWRHAVSGQVYIWLMNGSTLSSLGSPGTVYPYWEIQGVGDFNGDGKTDILWRHNSSGMLYIWLMDGSAVTSMGSPGTVGDGNWQIVTP